MISDALRTERNGRRQWVLCTEGASCNCSYIKVFSWKYKRNNTKSMIIRGSGTEMKLTCSYFLHHFSGEQFQVNFHLFVLGEAKCLLVWLIFVHGLEIKQNYNFYKSCNFEINHRIMSTSPNRQHISKNPYCRQRDSNRRPSYTAAAALSLTAAPGAS